MIPVSPVIPGHAHEEVRIAEHQDEYRTLPALPIAGGQAHVSRWELTEEELRTLLETKSLYLVIWTGGGPTQPVMLQVEPPEGTA